MKNTVKFFSMMLAAGAMMLASCEPEPGPEGPVTPKYTITVTANDAAYGTVTGGGEYDSAATATLTATPNEGYKFVNWNDGNENNPRIITVTGNATYTANFTEVAGVNVTFGENSWAAGYVNALYYPNGILIAAAQTAATDALPIVQLVNIGAPAVGTYTGTHNVTADGVSRDNVYLYYYDNNDEGIQLTYQDGSVERVGNWWSKDLTLNITALDVDAMTISCVVNTTMVHAWELVEGTADWATATTRSLTMNVVNQTMTNGTKSFLNAHRTAKIAR